MDNYSEYLYALEEYMDELEAELNSDYMLAMEAESASDGTEAPSSIGTKIRSLFNKLKRAVKRGDSAEAEQIHEKIKDSAKKLDDAADAAEESGDVRKKKGIITAANLGKAAAAAALITTGLAVSGQLYAKHSIKTGKIPKGAGKMLTDASYKICQVARHPIATTKTAIANDKNLNYLKKSYAIDRDRNVGKVRSAANAVAGLTQANAIGAYTNARNTVHNAHTRFNKFYHEHPVYTASMIGIAGSMGVNAVNNAIKKKKAKDAADTVEEMYGIPSYEVYDIIMEEYGDDMSIEDLDAQLAAEFED